MISVVIPFCDRDQKLALNLLRWMGELDGTLPAQCLLVADCRMIGAKIFEVYQAAKKVFPEVKTISTPYSLPDESWPKGPNWLFLTACREIRDRHYGPFLWLEPDCVPMKPGWLQAIDSEYQAVGKPYLGTRIKQDNGTVNLAGCAVYPEKAIDVFEGIPLTVAWDVARPADVAKLAHWSSLFWFFWGTKSKSPTFLRRPGNEKIENAMYPANIPKDAVLFHRCKDGSLINLLRQDRAVELAYPSFTIVITSFRRPEMLMAAYKSCQEAGIRKIIITATGINDRMTSCLDSMEANDPKLKILRHGNDITSNQSWFLGVEAAETEYAAILHDDDLVMPGYMKAVDEGISKYADLINLSAKMHGLPNKFLDQLSTEHGFISVNPLREGIKSLGSLSVSPIRGVFKRADLAEWLRCAERLPEECYYRPGFLVGNDLLIWLKACDKYSQMFNIPTPLVSYGNHSGSTTVCDIGTKAGKLGPIYDLVRKWHQEQIAETAKLVESSRLEILTIVLDGMPTLASHLPVFNRLKIPWHWHIVEGAAMNTHCTKWCAAQEARLSTDGTTEYLDAISNHPRITIYRKSSWDGKIEMVNAPLPSITQECVLLELDSDECWTDQQLASMVAMFDSDKLKTHAWFFCRYYFGPHLVMTTRNCYANNPKQEWKRAWRFKPGQMFSHHEPPILEGEGKGFSHAETERRGLVFEHYAYAFRKQLEYKESFYGYTGAPNQWDRLQLAQCPAKAHEYLAWISDKNCTIDLI